MISRSAGCKTLPAQQECISAFCKVDARASAPVALVPEVWPKRWQHGKASPLRGVTQICKHVHDEWSCARFGESPQQPQAILFFTQVHGLCPSAILLNLPRARLGKPQ